MKNYLTKFAALSSYNVWKNSAFYVEPNVTLIKNGNEIVQVIYQSITEGGSSEPDEPITPDPSGSGSGSGNGSGEESHNYANDYFTSIAREDNMSFSLYQCDTTDMIAYSLDNGETWITESSNATITTPLLNNGDKVLWKFDRISTAEHDGYGYYVVNWHDSLLGGFSGTGNFDVEGNIMSLLYGDNFINQTDLLIREYVFSELFKWQNHLINASNLILPATILTNYCYSYMFNGCTSLVTTPVLPATTLADYCYQNMFYGCTSLTAAPALPATTLTQYCYQSMFYGCTSLTTAPALPATTLAQNCYDCMFSECTELTTAPELPATTLAQGCYSNMFYGCTSLNYIKCLATDISTSDCTSSWVQYVASSGTFVKAASMTSWTTGVNGRPSGWTVEDAT